MTKPGGLYKIKVHYRHFNQMWVTAYYHGSYGIMIQHYEPLDIHERGNIDTI